MAILASLIPVAVGLIQGAKGHSDAAKEQAKSDALFSRRKAYKTPSEITDLFNQAQNNAQTGFDPTTLNYLTSQDQNSLNSTLNTAKLLGGDPNNFSQLIDQSFQNIFKIGSENDLVKMKKFDQLVSATQLVAQNKDAEFASQDNLLKDQLQAAAQRTQVARANEQGGYNLAANGLSAYASSKLFPPDPGKAPYTPPPYNPYSNTYMPPANVTPIQPLQAKVEANRPLIYKNPITG